MIRSLVIQPQRYYPHARESRELPRGSSYRMAYGDRKSWYIDDSWCCIQWYKSKYILPYCIEVEAKAPLYLPVSIQHPDIHWQYMLQGGYGINEVMGHGLLLTEGYQHQIYAACGDFLSYVPLGRHLIVGYNIVTDWLDKHREPAAAELEDLPQILLPDQLYRSEPAPITAAMLTELYYILQHPEITGIQQDTNIYAAVGRLQSLHQQEENPDRAPVHPLKQKIESIHRYIDHIVEKNDLVPYIQQIADHFSITINRLQKIHKKLYNESLQDYIGTKRLEQAVKLLAEGKTIKEVTYLQHYHDVPAFSNAFKNKYGVPPSQHQP
ncbi:helix-turn-helix transcriptional regulator [Sphingobacterium faecale]|uniref:Helix-turn-helix domain-containing protein n=1 Tax=Sphingobacterium faecale TaxID=2803775 RepID=A0ABS1RA00_9SPHI|nr:helix-turn-helix domain-containing protein [Sphingobacterium faecale]MBL1411498.1 helix-turn-helix domain-containing protein [Sphingobacterium faecale]